jgi:hypothetical protein
MPGRPKRHNKKLSLSPQVIIYALKHGLVSLEKIEL